MVKRTRQDDTETFNELTTTAPGSAVKVWIPFTVFSEDAMTRQLYLTCTREHAAIILIYVKKTYQFKTLC